MGQNATSDSFEIWNSGGGILNYTISDDVNWVDCSPTSGSSIGEPNTITYNSNNHIYLERFLLNFRHQDAL